MREHTSPRRIDAHAHHADMELGGVPALIARRGEPMASVMRSNLSMRWKRTVYSISDSARLLIDLIHVLHDVVDIPAESERETSLIQHRLPRRIRKLRALSHVPISSSTRTPFSSSLEIFADMRLAILGDPDARVAATERNQIAHSRLVRNANRTSPAIRAATACQHASSDWSQPADP
jgi:hypothetical protein